MANISYTGEYLIILLFDLGFRLLQPGHYDLLYPLYEDNEDGTPFFSSTQLKELCVPKRLEGNREEKMDANVSGHLAHRSIIADSYPSLDLTLLASNSSKLASVSKDMSRNDFLSQAGFLRHQSLAERISAVPRLEIRSVYPVVAKYPGSIAFLQNNNAGDNANAENGAKPLEEARFYILKGNYDELLSNSKKALNISSDRVIRFVPFNITEEKKPDITDIFDSLQDGDALHVTVEGLVRAKVISERGIAYAHIDISQYVTLEQLRDNLCQRLRLASEDYYIAEPSNIEALMKHASADVFSRTHNIDIVIDTVHKDINIEVHLKSSAETIVVTVEIPEDYESYESFCDTLAVQCGIPVGVFLSIEHKESNGKTAHISAANIKDMLEDGSSIEITICSVCASAANNGLYDVAHRDKTLLFRLSGQCGHVLCKSCMNTLVEASGKKPQKLSTEEFEEGGTSLYQYHELPVDLTDIDGTMNDILPFLKLCDITCPYPGCRTTVVAEDIQSTDKHVTDFEKALLRLRKHFEILSTYRKCSLDGILYCSDEPEPVFNLYQLDCDHFFHISCLASQLKSVLGAARRDPQPVVCPECIRTNHRCECSACDDRTDANISGAHNITDSEIKQMTLSDECPNFGPSEQALWEQVTHTYFLKTMQGYKAIVCRCGNAIVFEPREYVTEIDCPYGCNFVSCAKVCLVS